MESVLRFRLGKKKPISSRYLRRAAGSRFLSQKTETSSGGFARSIEMLWDL